MFSFNVRAAWGRDAQLVVAFLFSDYLQYIWLFVSGEDTKQRELKSELWSSRVSLHFHYPHCVMVLWAVPALGDDTGIYIVNRPWYQGGSWGKYWMLSK